MNDIIKREKYKIILKQYTDEYYNFIYKVKKNAYKKYVEKCWGNWDENVQQEYFENFINTYGKNLYIIELNGIDIGFYNDELLDDFTYEIGNICIIEEYQGKGIGTQILNNILDKNKEKNIKIQCFKQNPVRNLYKRLGFVLDGETKYHYQMIKLKSIK